MNEQPCNPQQKPMLVRDLNNHMERAWEVEKTPLGDNINNINNINNIHKWLDS